MACCVTGTTTTNTTTTNNGTIAQLLKRIDQLQKEAIIANAANQCDNCMISAMYNTKPIATSAITVQDLKLLLMM